MIKSGKGGGNTKTGLVFEGKMGCRCFFEYIPLARLGLPVPSNNGEEE